MKIFEKINRLNVRYILFSAIVFSFLAAYFIPELASNSKIGDLVSFVGILFAILVGFFIAHLYSRYQLIRSNASIDASSLGTFYFYATLISKEINNNEWLIEVEDTIEEYIHFFMPLRWEEYNKTEKYFNNLCLTLEKIDYSGNKADKIMNNLLSLLNEHSTAREKLVMSGKDSLSVGSWLTISFLGFLLFLSVLFIKDDSIISILFTGGIFSSISILFIVIRDLNNLNFGESSVAIESYERVLDAIGRDRYYKKKI